MKKVIYLTLLFLSLLILAVRLGTITFGYFFEGEEIAGLKLLSTPQGAEIFIDNSVVGKTPFETSDLKAGKHSIEIRKDNMRWQGLIEINGGTKAVINRELSVDDSSSAGEILTLDKGSGATIISSVKDVDVEINGKYFGKTPLLADLPPGEHTFVLSHISYLKRSIRANIPDGFNLILNIDLSLTEADLSSITTLPTIATAKVIVKDTPTGFLRVREKASLSSKEIARVKPKEELVLLEELSGWFRVRLSDGKEGYVANSYVEKLKP